MNYKCFFCHVKSFEKLLADHEIESSQKETIVKEFLNYLGSIHRNTIAPEIARETNALIRRVLNNPDPYKKVKQTTNKYLIDRYDELKEIIETSENKFETALRLSIAGNIIDSVGSPNFNIMKTINFVLNSDFAINHFEKLKSEIDKAKTVLYLGDNAGEIVLDKLFIETLKHNNLYFAVRGAPVINDVTIEDAELVEMQKVAKVISNGYDAPSTLLHKVSDEFLEIYNKADVIISKGMGNLEGLLHNKNNKIFFLLMVKCQPIGELINVEKNNFVVMQNL